MASSLNDLHKQLQLLHRTLDQSTSEGFETLKSFVSGAEKSLDSLNKTTTNTVVQSKQVSKAINEVGKEVNETTEEVRTLNNVLNDLFNKFVSIDIKKILSDASIILISLEAASIKLSEKIGSTITNVANNAAEKVFDFMSAFTQDFINEHTDKIFNLISKIAQPISDIGGKFASLINKTVGGFGKKLGAIGLKFSELVSGGLKAGMATAITGFFAVLGIAKKLGEKGDTVKDIQKNVEEDIRAQAKAIELGLRALPRILFETLPPILIEFVDRLIFGIFKAIAELTNIIINGFKAIFTKEGLKNIGRSIKQGLKASFEEFFRRINVIGGILSKRSGGRIPSARGGIKFTGNQQGLALLHPNEFVVPESGQMPQAVERAMTKQSGSGINIVINASVVENNAIDELVRQIERRFQTFGSSTSPLFGGR